LLPLYYIEGAICHTKALGRVAKAGEVMVEAKDMPVVSSHGLE
jgi:hypothetical protein